MCCELVLGFDLGCVEKCKFICVGGDGMSLFCYFNFVSLLVVVLVMVSLLVGIFDFFEVGFGILFLIGGFLLMMLFFVGV